MKKFKKMIVCTVMIGATLLSVPAAMAEEAVIVPIETQGNGDTAVIQSYIYEWRYKVMNGHLYRRLYNCTKSCWEGDWILVY